MSLLYLLLRRVLAVAALRFRSREFKELEILVLRHELAVLRRQVARPRLHERDRVCLAAPSRLLHGASLPSFFVRPETLLGCDLTPPEPRPHQLLVSSNPPDGIHRHDRLGGLIHEYTQAA